MTLFHALERWEIHCCGSLVSIEFADHFYRTKVEKLGDADPAEGRRR